MALILLSCRLPAIAQYGSGQGSYGTLILPNNLVTNGQSPVSFATNTAPYAVYGNSSNTYSANVLYTNDGTLPQRAILVGSVCLQPSTTIDASMALNYTNGGKGYTLFMQAGHSNPSPGISYMAFSVPLSPNATFQFATNGTSGTIAYLTNTILWKE